MKSKDRFIAYLRKADARMYQITLGAAYPLNFCLALLFRLKMGKGVLHIATVTHQPYVITRHLRAQGYRADFLCKGEGWLLFDEKAWDYRIRKPKLPGPLRFLHEFLWMWRLYPRYEVIHSHFLQLIGDNFWELRFLKIMGKKVVFHFRGDDIREKEANLRLNPGLNCCQECDYPETYCHDSEKDRLRKLARLHGDLFLVTTPDLNDFMPEAIHFPFFLPEVPGQSPAPLSIRERGQEDFKILHVTNHEGIDGTKYLRQAISRLTEEGYRIKLLVPHNKPFPEMLKLYSEADLTVGKLLMGYYANSQIESLYFGLPTMCYIRDAFWKKIPDCPIINVRPDNLYDELKFYLDHRDQLNAIALKGPEFVRKYHSGTPLAKRLIGLYENC